MKKTAHIVTSACFSLALFSASAMAGDILNRDGNFADIPEEEIEEYEWKEGKMKLPPYPDDDDLIEFQVDLGNPQFQYFLDEKSLSVGDDQVVRYTLVVRSHTGAENIFHEGLRCGAKQYKTYAYGTKGKFRERRNPQWRPVKSGGMMPYRSDLLDIYLCRDSFPRSPEDAVDAIEGVGQGDTQMGGTKLF
jgi:hypothetical protein